MRLQVNTILKSKTQEIEKNYENESVTQELENERDARSKLETNLADVKKQNKNLVSEKKQFDHFIGKCGR